MLFLKTNTHTNNNKQTKSIPFRLSSQLWLRRLVLNKHLRRASCVHAEFLHRSSHWPTSFPGMSEESAPGICSAFHTEEASIPPKALSCSYLTPAPSLAGLKPADGRWWWPGWAQGPTVCSSGPQTVGVGGQTTWGPWLELWVLGMIGQGRHHPGCLGLHFLRGFKHPTAWPSMLLSQI